MKISSGVDGNYYLHRAFSIAGEASPKEGVTRIFLSLVCRDLLRVKAQEFVVAFDGREVFRYKLYPQYKANRKEDRVGGASTTKDIIYQTSLPYLMQVLADLKIPYVQYPNLEADDVLASIAAKYKQVVNLTRDKDAYQYVSDTCRLFISDAKSPYYVDPEYVTQRMGVKPKQMVMYQTLLGDAQDNIPSVARLTPAKVKKICLEYKTLSNFYKSLSKQDRKRFKGQIELNHKLVKLVTDENVKLYKMPKLENTSNFPLSVSRYVDFLYTQRSLF